MRCRELTTSESPSTLLGNSRWRMRLYIARYNGEIMQVTPIAPMTGIEVATQGRGIRHKNPSSVLATVHSVYRVHTLTIASYHVLNFISCYCILIASYRNMHSYVYILWFLLSKYIASHTDLSVHCKGMPIYLVTLIYACME